MPNKIIYHFKEIKYYGLNKLFYNNKKISKEELFKSKRVYMHKFIYGTDSTTYIMYSTFVNDERIIGIFMPIMGVIKDGVLLDYEYYNYVCNSYSDIGMINKKYLINYEGLGFESDFDLDIYKSIESKKSDMELHLRFSMKQI